MTLGWRINALCCAFCCGWIVFAAMFQRSGDLLGFAPSRIVAGFTGVLLLTLGAGLRRLCRAIAVEAVSKPDAGTVARPARPYDPETAGTRDACPYHSGTDFAVTSEENGLFQPPQECGTATALTAEEAWEKARSMMHNVVPGYDTDGKYLSLVRYAADLGHGDALVKLGEYACRRGCLVEAAYWESMALLRGGDDGGARMDEYARCWTSEGCPDEVDLVHPFFSPEQSSFGRSVLRYYSGIDVPLALMRFVEMAQAGNTDAANLLQYLNVETEAFGK